MISRGETGARRRLHEDSEGVPHEEFTENKQHPTFLPNFRGSGVLPSPERRKNRFSLDTQVVQIANPFGGGLYIEVPDGAALGQVSIEVHGAVEMPTYAVEEHLGLNHSVDQFLRGINEAHVPYFELIGRRFNFTHPNRFGALYSDPQAVLAKMDSAFDAIDVMTGRPPAGIRAEWLAGVRMIPVGGSVFLSKSVF